jgi:flavin reductase (DIM6/NTAB) family NADH-FMN oxidoreductase RutF
VTPPPDTSVDPAAVDPAAFRRTTGSFATGVTVITTAYDGERHGLTANSFTSVSMDPPLVLFCLARTAGSMAAFEGCDAFAVNVLSSDQQELSRQFATPSDDKFVAVALREGVTGAPVLAECHAVLECTPHQMHEAGDHVIVVGKVEAIDVHDESEPLLFHRSRYRMAG